MVRTTIFTVIVLISFLFFACGDGTERESERSPDDVTEAYESVESDVKVTKDEFISTVRDEMEDIENDLQEVRMEIEEESGNQRDELRERYKQLTQEKNDLEDRLEVVRERSEENWHEMRSEIDVRLDSLKADFNELKNELDSDR